MSESSAKIETRGRKPLGERAQSASEKAKKHRASLAAKSPESWTKSNCLELLKSPSTPAETVVQAYKRLGEILGIDQLNSCAQLNK